ncbi:MAG TPA: hypothetical protein VMR70_18800 [Flavisolibacter sp.]|nr:hypothetical protein [Flavisolibacter sp.]
MEKRIEKVSHLSSHYLVRAKANSHPYYQEFLAASAVLKSAMTPAEYDYWCTEKMLLKNQAFLEKTFIQYAAETAVVRYCIDRFLSNVKLEVKVNPVSGKDVDVQFKDGGFTYNLEVKCAEFGAKENIENQDAWKYSTVGRIDDRHEPKNAMANAIDEGMTLRGEPLKPHLESKNMDNNMKDYLTNAHQKFADTTPEDTANVLIVGCGDAMDMQQWYYYLFAPQGLFTTHPFHPPANYSNVDAVLLTNQYFKHHKFFEKNIENSWTLAGGFNLLFPNPNRKAKKEKALKHLLSVLPNWNEELSRYRVPAAFDVPPEVTQSVLIHTFVKAELEKGQGLYLFEKKPQPPTSSPTENKA